jgi:hypothetical protein
MHDVFIHFIVSHNGLVIFFSYGSNLPAFENIFTGLKSTIGGKDNETVIIMTEYLNFTRL